MCNYLSGKVRQNLTALSISTFSADDKKFVLLTRKSLESLKPRGVIRQTEQDKNLLESKMASPEAEDADDNGRFDGNYFSKTVFL